MLSSVSFQWTIPGGTHRLDLKLRESASFSGAIEQLTNSDAGPAHIIPPSTTSKLSEMPSSVTNF